MPEKKTAEGRPLNVARVAELLRVIGHAALDLAAELEGASVGATKPKATGKRRRPVRPLLTPGKEVAVSDTDRATARRALARYPR